MDEELEQIRLVLEELLGRRSRWSGVLELTDDPTVNGVKPFRCDILINRALVGLDVRWRTLIHEMLHTFSAGYHRRDYDEFPGWEEGVVEQIQRLLRPTVLARLGIAVDEGVFVQAEVSHNYNVYLRALEALRQHLDIPVRPFHLDLLAEPIRDRSNSVLRRGQAMSLVGRAALVRVYSVSNAALKQRV